jgi:hypothetical protein
MASEISQQDDLDWLAFQYAAGELQGTERDAFELLLATDLLACEALAKAVQLCQAIAICEAELVADTFPVGSVMQPNLETADVQSRATAIRRESLAAIRQGFAQPDTSLSRETLAAKSTSGRRPVAWHVFALVGSAACLALMTNWMGTGQPNLSGRQTADLQAGLVSLWIDGAAIDGAGAEDTELTADSQLDRQSLVVAGNVEASNSVVLPHENVLADGTGHGAVVLKSNESVVNSVGLDSDDGDAVPGWMLAAVAERQREVGAMDEEVIQD